MSASRTTAESKPMRIGTAADHGGLELKQYLGAAELESPSTKAVL